MSPRIVAIGFFAAGIALSAEGLAKCKDARAPIGTGCRHFGEDWSEGPAFALTFGPRMLTFRKEARFGGIADAPFAFRAEALEGSALRAYGGFVGVVWAPSPYFYFGAEAAAGAGAYRAGPVGQKGMTLTLDDSWNAMQIQGGAVLGLRLPLGHVGLRAEVVGGGQFVSVSLLAASAAKSTAAQATADAWLLEPRVALDIWVTPYFTLTPFVGMPDGAPEATNGGVAFTGHVRAFDGRFTLL